MKKTNQAISDIGIVPVIKLNNPERDTAPLVKALCAGDVPVAEVTFRAALKFGLEVLKFSPAGQSGGLPVVSGAHI